MPTTYDSRRYALVNRWDPRHMRTVQRVVAPQPGWQVLDVGCGRGHLTMRLQELGCDATGVDANPQAAAVAVTSGIETMRAERLGFPDGTFDLVVSVHAIEHIPPLEQTLAEMARVLKPGGRLLLIYPAEPIRGIFAVPTAVILHGNPFKARSIHVHKLTPRKVRGLTDALGVRHLHSEFNVLSSPQFVPLLEKPAS